MGRKTVNLQPYLTHVQKLTQNRSQTKCKNKTHKILEENIGDNLCDLNCADFLGHRNSRTTYKIKETEFYQKSIVLGKTLL